MLGYYTVIVVAEYALVNVFLYVNLDLLYGIDYPS